MTVTSGKIQQVREIKSRYKSAIKDHPVTGPY
jgi:hypothetical protein